MARGKQKYRDVVGKAKGSVRKNAPKKQRPRKTYSLFKPNNKNQTKKRVYHHHEVEPEAKRLKVEEKPLVESSESEDEGEDNVQQLLNTFSSNLRGKKSLAIDSSDESDVDEEEEVVLNEEISNESSDESSLEAEEEHVSDNNTKQANVQDEEEEVEELEIDLETDKEDDVKSSHDPFVKHVFYDLHESVLESLQNSKISVNSTLETWPKLGKLLVQIPKSQNVAEEPCSEFSIAEKKTYAPLCETPKKIDVKSAKPSDLFIKSQIVENLKKANKSLFNNTDFLTPLQGEIFGILNNYQDFYFPERTFDNAEEIRFVYCLHAVNHILKTRLKVVHHNARLTKKSEVPEEFRDQGLVRPKILIVVPFKDAAYKIVQMLIDIILPEEKGNVIKKNRFDEDYTGNELIMPKRNPKPEDYEKLFTGNTSDDFKIGLTVTKKSVKLYVDFYSADIIIASPLGLRTVIGAEGEPERDYDFLASIELLIFDQTEIFLMQNWDHVLHILNHLHLQPKDSHGTDFARVRTWSLNGWSKYYRQTLIFSSVILPEINAIFNKKCMNYSGKIKSVNEIQSGKIGQVFVQLPHVFHKFDAENAADAIEARFQFFLSKILPQQKDSLMKQTLVFVANYFDYVRLRNYFKREDVGFVQICEYSKEGKIARARDMFYHGDAHFMLYTERYHFFHRIRVKGIRHLVFYQLPSFPHFYYEMCNLMQEGNMNRKVGNMSNMTVSVIYSKYDVHQLAQIVGTERASKMVQSDRKVHMMVTGAD